MNKQKPMSKFVFKIMAFIMSVRERFRNINEEVSLAGVKSGNFILDFGCGLGFNTIPTAQKVGDAGKVFALDINQEAIRIVNKKMKKYNLTNIKTILSDCDTNLDSESIDIVYLHNILPMIKNKEEVLNEIYRVLKVNGRLSYISRRGSRIAGKRVVEENSMSDEELRECLETNNKFKLIEEKNGHFIFKKNDSRRSF